MKKYRLITPINESTTRKIKEVYLEKRHEKRENGDDDMTNSELPVKKRGRPLLLGKRLDDAVQDYVSMLRDYGCPVNTTVVVAAARGVAKAIDRTRLAQYGGPATLTVDWAKSLLKRMNFTRRRATTKSSPQNDDLKEVKQDFLAEVLETVEFNEIPPELIFNWDQTGINLVPSALWTMNKKGEKRVAIAGHLDKRQITAVMCGNLVGELLPMQLVYAGKTKRCHPAYKFPEDWLISHTHNHWANEDAMLEYVRNVIVPFVECKRDMLGLDVQYPALAIFDHFKGQLTQNITTELDENHIHSVLIPAACTGQLQPMDISVNKVVKSLLRNKFSDWYADEITELFIDGEDTVVDISTARMKCIVGEWIVQVFEYLQANPQIIVHGFRHAGVFDALGIIDNDELPEYGDNLESNDDSELDEDVDDDCIEAMSRSSTSCLSVATVYTDSDGDLPTDPIVISSSEE